MRAALISRAIPLALAAAALGGGPAARAVAVWPPELHMTSAPGEVAVAELQLVNDSPAVREVAVALTDWDVKEGERVTVPPGTGERSLVPFLLASLPPRLRLEPGETLRLAVAVRRPPEDGGTRWLGVAVVSELPGAGPPNPAAPRLLRRRVVRLYHTPLPLAPVRGAVAAIVPPRDGGRWTVEYDNPTDRVVTVRGEWRLTDDRGREVARGAVGPFLAYPGRHPVPFGPLPALEPGAYHLLVLATPEGGETTAGQLRVEVRAQGNGGSEGP